METYWIKEAGTPVKLDVVETLPSEGYLWIDFVREEAPHWAEEVHRISGVEIFESHVIDSLNTAHPSFFDTGIGYEMIVFQGLSASAQPHDFDSRPAVFFLFDRLLVTVRPADSISVPRIKIRFSETVGKIPRRPVSLLHQLLSIMVDRFMALREPLRLQLEEWQESLLDPHHPFDDWTKLMTQKNRLRRLQALCEEQEDAIEAWRADTDVEFDHHLTVRFNDLVEHIRRVLSHSTHFQAELESLVQINFAAASHRTNEIMKVLTVVAAIFLPLTLVAGIFGMNFEYMPELRLRYAYFVVLGSMAALGIGLYLFFRKRTWI